MKIFAFGASSSKTSINKDLAFWAAHYIPSTTVDFADLSTVQLPLFSVDVEQEEGIPSEVIAFYERIQAADLILISLAEHNGTYTAHFKNLMDWLSRHNGKFFNEKNVVLLATSPGIRGGAGVMQAAVDRFPRHGARICCQFSLPEFERNFDKTAGITSPELLTTFREHLKQANLL